MTDANPSKDILIRCPHWLQVPLKLEAEKLRVKMEITSKTARTENAEIKKIMNEKKVDIPTTNKLYLNKLPCAILLAAIPTRCIELIPFGRFYLNAIIPFKSKPAKYRYVKRYFRHCDQLEVPGMRAERSEAI